MLSYIPWFDHFNPSLSLFSMYIYSLGCLMSITNLACSRSTSVFPSPKHVCCLVFQWLVFSKIHLHQCPPSFSLKSRADINDFDQCNVILVTDILGPYSEGTKNFAASTWASQNACSGEVSYCVGILNAFKPPCCEEGQACHVEKMRGETEMAGELPAFSAMWVRRYKMCEWKGHLGYLVLWNL